MYGQFHTTMSLRSAAPSATNNFSNKKNRKKKILGLISLIFIIVFVSNSSFAGSSRPKLRGGNGNAQGR